SDVVGIVAGRSGLGVKKGVTLSNSIGVIDSDYRGEICVGLINHGSEPFTVERGDRIAQLFFVPVCHAAFLPVESLDETERGTGGFGSTGKN
ncbi:MAG: dUTP diphosphatase, partial [Clostridia bacterium]|nr:dUTP diphosphatase [Clostridia bacterium]